MWFQKKHNPPPDAGARTNMIGQIGIIVYCRVGSVYAQARIAERNVTVRSAPNQPPLRKGMRIRITRRHISEWIAERVPPPRRKRYRR